MAFARRQDRADVTRVRSGWLRGLGIGVVVLISAAPARAVEITGVSPNRVWNSAVSGDVTLTITGSGFFPCEFPMVILGKEGEPGIQATNVTFLTQGLITADFDLAGVAGERRDLYVSLLVGDDTLDNAVTILLSPQIERISAWGGPVQAMEVVGNIGYVARGSGMVVLDVTDPTNMIELSSIDLRAAVLDLAVQGNYAFVVGRIPAYLSVIDISDPAHLRLVVTGVAASGSKTPTDVAVYGNAAYVIFNSFYPTDGNLRILDISDPEMLEPGPQSWLSLADMQYCYALAIHDGHLYGAAPDAGTGLGNHLRIYDVSDDPLSPTLVGAASLFWSYGLTAVAVDDGLAAVTSYALNHGSTLSIVDVSNPAAPFLTGIFTDLYAADDVGISNGIVYVADREIDTPPDDRTAKGLAVIDVATDPTDPTLIGTFLTHGAVNGVTVVGTTAYLHDQGEGVVAMDVSDPGDPVRLGSYHSPGYIRGIDKEGDHLYFTDWWNGVTVLDVSNSSTPALIGFRQNGPVSGRNGGIQVEAGLAYVAAGYNGLQVLDLSNPPTPVLIGAYPPPVPHPSAYFGYGLGVRGGVLITPMRIYGNPVFDVSDPANPQVAFMGLGGSMEQNWVISEDFVAYAANPCCGGGVGVDVSDPYNPVFEDVVLGYATDIALDGRRLYTTMRTDSAFWGLYVYDILDTPEGHVSLVSELIIGQASGVAARDGIAYVTGVLYASGLDYYRLSVFDTNGPVPTVIAFTPPAYGHRFVHLDGRYVYTGGEDYLDRFGGPSMVTWDVRVPGSVELDGDIDLIDFARFQNCFGGSMGDDCDSADFDSDGDVDNDDFAAFATEMTGAL